MEDSKLDELIVKALRRVFAEQGMKKGYVVFAEEASAATIKRGIPVYLPVKPDEYDKSKVSERDRRQCEGKVKKNILTRSDIMCLNDGEHIEVGKRDIFTDLAKDEILRKKITITYC